MVKNAKYYPSFVTAHPDFGPIWREHISDAFSGLTTPSSTFFEGSLLNYTWPDSK